MSGPSSPRPLRVLHGTYEIAGQGMVLARGLRAAGCEAHSLTYRVDWDGRRPDHIVELDPLPGPLARGAAMLGTFARMAPGYDVFHFHFGTSFLPRLLDVPWLRAMGKRIVFHFHGCEVRNRAHMLATHRLSTCTECDPFCRPAQQQRLLARAARLADRVFFSTLDLAESVPNGRHLPLAIEVDRWAQAGGARALPDADRRNGVDGPVVVMHAPTNRLIKGTRHVEAAIGSLRREFPRLELRMVERRPWAEMPALLAECDILVDQLMMGWYGLLAIEGMAAGRAVVTHLRGDFAGAGPGIPVAGAEPATIEDVLRTLVRDPALRHRLGEGGQRYVRAVHDAPVVGARLLSEYGELRAR